MELYHVLNRGVEKRNLFLDDEDRARFVHDLFEFNNPKPTGSNYYLFRQNQRAGHILDLRSPEYDPGYKENRIVDLHGWCLMKNHYHLLLSERATGGLTLFIRKLNIGYAKYFNEKYERTGTLFQGRTKKKLIDRDSYFLHILNYVHLNPLDYSANKNWREHKIKNAKQALELLSKYRWSSYLDYCNNTNFPSILTTDLFKGVFKNYRNEIEKYLKNLSSSGQHLDLEKNLLLE